MGRSKQGTRDQGPEQGPGTGDCRLGTGDEGLEIRDQCKDRGPRTQQPGTSDLITVGPP